MPPLAPDFANRRVLNAQMDDKAVRFSSMSRLAVFLGPPKSEHPKLYYSKDEFDAMQAAQVRALQDVHRSDFQGMLSRSFVCGVESVEVPVITGLENLLTQALARKVVTRRALRLRAVLLEQARQGESGPRDPDKISLASQRYSKWSVERAEKIGAFTAELVQDKS